MLGYSYSLYSSSPLYFSFGVGEFLNMEVGCSNCSIGTYQSAENHRNQECSNYTGKNHQKLPLLFLLILKFWFMRSVVDILYFISISVKKILFGFIGGTVTEGERAGECGKYTQLHSFEFFRKYIILSDLPEFYLSKINSAKNLPLTGLEPLTLWLYYFQSHAYPTVLIPIVWETET